MPSLLQVLMILAAISPRFAMRTLENMAGNLRFYLGEGLPDVHFVPLPHVNLPDPSPHLGRDRYLRLHRLEDEERLASRDSCSFGNADLDDEPGGRSKNLG